MRDDEGNQTFDHRSHSSIRGVAAAMNVDAARSVCVVLLLLGTLAVIGPHSTTGKFSDGHTGTASFTAARNFNNGNNGDGGPSSNTKVYNDVNGNGYYDKQEDETIKVKNLNNYEDRQANVVISSNIGELDSSNSEISITANTITSEVNISSTSNSVTLEASRIDLHDTTVSGEDGGVTIRSSGEVNLDGATVVATGGPIRVEGQSVSMGQSRLSASNDDVTVSADRNGGGRIEATAAEIHSDTGDVVLDARSAIVLDSGRLSAKNGKISANFSDEDSTLYVDGTVVNNGDGPLYYSPSGVSVVPSERTENGDVRQESG